MAANYSDSDAQYIMYRNRKIALVVPCYNEEVAIPMVIRDFRQALPEMDIYVFNNNSADKTRDVSLKLGVTVIDVKLPGKGNVVRRMFADVEADIYVMVDGDATYDAASVHELIDKVIDEGADMVVGCREVTEEISRAAYRNGHQLGNKMLTGSVQKIFGGQFTDMLSGYRAFSRRYAKSFPAISQGFEIETELTVHALELRMPYAEVATPYGSRPEGSSSKLSTYRDGWRILKTIIKLYVHERPMQFYGASALLLALLSLLLALPLLLTYLQTGQVPRFPTAILSASIMICALLSGVTGLILDNVTKGRHESKRLSYLAIPKT